MTWPQCLAGLIADMLARIATRLVVLAAIIGVVAKIVPGVHVSGYIWLIGVALVYSLVNLILGPIARLLSLPLIALTFGLFLLVINAGLLAVTAALSDHLDIDSFAAAVVGSALISVFSWLAERLLPLRK